MATTAGFRRVFRPDLHTSVQHILSGLLGEWPGSVPVRSRTFPRGFPWNSRGRAIKALLGTILADFSFEALKRHWQRPGRPGVMEQPEDLGKTTYQRVPGHSPASMWQYPQFFSLLEMEGVQTVAFSQLDFGAASPKPTRFLLRDLGPLPNTMFSGPPEFHHDGTYAGPCPPRTGTPLIGRNGQGFRTNSSAAWPPQLCSWVAQQIIATYLQYSEKQGQCNDNREKRKMREEDYEDSARVCKKKAKIQGATPGDSGANAMDPPVKGGNGPPMACNWKGVKTPFHDGGGLASPGRWPRGERLYPQSEAWCKMREKLWLEVLKTAGGYEELEKEAFKMAKGGEHFNLVKNEELLLRLRRIMGQELGLTSDVGKKADGQPFFLRLMEEVLESAGDTDWGFLRQAEEGLPVGVLDPLPRSPTMFERQEKWPLDPEAGGEAMLEAPNYISAEEHRDHLRSHLEAEVQEGLMEKMTEAEFSREFGSNRAIAALAVLVEDDQGKKRVIHDGSNKVKVNHRIKCLDKIRMPGAREKRSLLEVYRAEKEVVLSLVGDFEKAHRRFKYQRREQGFLACKASSDSHEIYVNKVGTFGVTSTPYWWAKISGALMRITHYILGGEWQLDMLLYADDLEVLGPSRKGRIAAVLAFLVLASLGAPFEWKKQRGGLCTEWVGITTDYATYSLGLSERRTEWLCGWIGDVLKKGVVSWREFAAGLGRLGFSALALPWERPFLGPLYSWSSATMGTRKDLELPWAIAFILRWIQQRLKDGERMEQVALPWVNPTRTVKIWTDAKATDDQAWIGGWQDEGEGTKGAEWFALEVTEDWMPWLKSRKGNPKRMIAALEMLATILAMKLWCSGGGQEYKFHAQAFTDNLGNDFILRKGMSTKFPLTLLVMEASMMMRNFGFTASLNWINRDGNQGADDLTNFKFDSFDLERRVEVDTAKVEWFVLDKLTMESQVLYDEIRKRKEQRKLEGPLKKGRKKQSKFFSRWSS